MLRIVRRVPPFTWGRDELGSGDMRNSNSLVCWLLVWTGHDAAAIQPPAGGRAPGRRVPGWLGGWPGWLSRHSGQLIMQSLSGLRWLGNLAVRCIPDAQSRAPVVPDFSRAESTVSSPASSAGERPSGQGQEELPYRCVRPGIARQWREIPGQTTKDRPP